MFRCEDWRWGCKGKWYIYEKDQHGLGIEHSVHSLLKEEHACMDIWREVGETAMSIVNFLKMDGDIPYKADY